jgi:tRNA (guanine37-N1)-methyltransferase
MMKVYIITPFPEIISSVLGESMLAKAEERGKVEYHILNLFEFLENKNDRIDDYPFGGGNGMIIKPGPVFNAFESINDAGRVVFPTPDGELLNHELVKDLSKEKSLVFICGHYKGIDQRIRDSIVTDEISIGDFVLTGGELPTLIILDSVVRLIKGVLNKYESASSDSFYDNLLDGPHYTRPQDFRGMKVPDVLISGNHKKINDWFLKERLKKTKKKRKDLLK